MKTDFFVIGDFYLVYRVSCIPVGLCLDFLFHPFFYSKIPFSSIPFPVPRDLRSSTSVFIILYKNNIKI